MAYSSIVRRGRRAAHGFLLFAWRFLPLPARRAAIFVLYPRFPIGAVAIIRDEGGRLLLVRQTYHREGVRWAPPGGWVGPSESPRAAAVRETFEETGLQVTAGRVLTVGSGPYREISLAFECSVVGGAEFRPSKETDEIGYFALDRLPIMTADTRRLTEQCLDAQARWPLDPAAPPARDEDWPASDAAWATWRQGSTR